jgi:2,4-diketo-3-deoxy-L-fuconate hydrolase
MGHTPQRYLKGGEVVSLGIAGLGEQRSAVKAWAG